MCKQCAIQVCYYGDFQPNLKLLSECMLLKNFYKQRELSLQE